MKAKFLFIVFVAISLLSCGKKQDKCILKLNIMDSTMLHMMNGRKLYLSLDSTVIDSLMFDSKTRQLTKVLTPKDNNLNIVELIAADDNASRFGSFIMENGTVTIDWKESDDSVYGTPLNDSIRIASELYFKISDKLENKYREALDTTTNEAKLDSIQTLYFEEYQDNIKTEYLKIFENHLNDALGHMALTMLSISRLDAETMLKYIDQAGDLVKNSTVIKELTENLIYSKETSAGKMFKDFSGQDDYGKTVKLSDYVGKGKYVIVDFWASWCTPCREEIPSLIKLYNTYKDKNVEVIGVGVWDNKEDHLKAVKDLKIPYPQILNESEATKLYSIDGIPQIILFAPDGKIVARNLRGNDIEKTLKNTMDK